MSRLAIILAVNTIGVIGKDNSLLWSLPNDLSYFRKKTMHKPIIMGRKTFESIGRVLANRENIIISRQQDLNICDAHVVKSLPKAIDKAKKLSPEVEEVMIIGGGQIYKQAMPLANKIYMTLVNNSLTGDVIFPYSITDLLESGWVIKDKLFCKKDQKHKYDYTFYELEK